MAQSDHQRVEEILSKVYYDVASGFGSIAKTLEQARKIDSSITRGDVQCFLAKQELRQSKKRRKDNSWVSFGPREGFQVDLADFARDSEYRYALFGWLVQRRRQESSKQCARSDTWRARLRKNSGTRRPHQCTRSWGCPALLGPARKPWPSHHSPCPLPALQPAFW
jgi:hypothetical protein